MRRNNVEHKIIRKKSSFLCRVTQLHNLIIHQDDQQQQQQ